MKRLHIIALSFLFIATGCSNGSNLVKTTTQPLTKNQELTSFTGVMEWTDTTTAESSLCGANITANISVALEVNTHDNTVLGTGTIEYSNIAYEKNRTCSDCIVAGTEPVEFAIDGTYDVEDEQTHTLTLTPNQDTLLEALSETQTSESCFGDKPKNTVEAQQLLYSLQQAEFFKEWSIAAPTKAQPVQTKEFKWQAGNHAGKGTLTLQ